MPTDPAPTKRPFASDPWANDEGWQCDPQTEEAVCRAVGMSPWKDPDDPLDSGFYPTFEPSAALSALQFHVESFGGSFTIEFEQPAGHGSDQWRVFLNDPDRSKGRAMAMGSTLCEAACCAILLDKRMHG